MRDIKFRAWDNKNKVMITEDNVYDVKCSYKSYYKEEDDQDILVLFDYFQDVVTCPDIDIMEYIGLLDCKNNEICESDIVSYDSYYIGDNLIPGNVGVVKFGNGSFYIDVTYAPELCAEEISNCNIKVIGNTYENPELFGDNR